MKVAMLVNNLSVSGGYQKLVLRLSSELRAMGHLVTIYTTTADESKCYPELIRREAIVSLSNRTGSKRISKLGALFRNAFAPIFDLAKYRRMARLVGSRPDAIVVHDDLSLRTLFFLRKAARQRICWMLNNELDPRKLSLRTLINDCVRSASTMRELALSAAKAIALTADWIAIRSSIAKVDIFATYDSRNSEAVKRLLGRPSSVVVRAGADVSQFHDLRGKRQKRPGNVFRVLSVGVFFPHRRYEDLVRAIKLARESGVPSEAVIVGLQEFHPEYATSIRSLTDELRCNEYIHFHEFVRDEDLRELFCDADAFAFVNDGLTWGIAVFEAIAAGLPVIVTTNVGAAELLEHRLTGWLVEPKSPNEIAGCIAEIYANRDLAEKVVQKAIDDVLPLVTWRAYARRMERLIQQGPSMVSVTKQAL